MKPNGYVWISPYSSEERGGVEVHLRQSALSLESSHQSCEAQSFSHRWCGFCGQLDKSTQESARSAPPLCIIFRATAWAIHRDGGRGIVARQFIFNQSLNKVKMSSSSHGCAWFNVIGSPIARKRPDPLSRRIGAHLSPSLRHLGIP